jgi:hypothetical protein
MKIVFMILRHPIAIMLMLYVLREKLNTSKTYYVGIIMGKIRINKHIIHYGIKYPL